MWPRAGHSRSASCTANSNACSMDVLLIKRNGMALSCPNCQSTDLRLSRRKRTFRKFTHIIGFYDIRCQNCDHTFRSNIYRLSQVHYAKCPACHRMDLSRWTREYYSPPFLTRFMLAMGAKPVRCEYCRLNFWSFRFVREKFSKLKRSSRSQVLIPVEIDSEREPESDAKAKLN